MVRPSEGFGLLDQQGKTFSRRSYIDEFAPYRWTYVVGFMDVLLLFLLREEGFVSLRATRDRITSFRDRAIKGVPAQWQSCFSDGHWEECAVAQVRAACNGRPLRFDKACQAIIALELTLANATSEALRSLDLYSVIRLRPAVYALRGLDHRARAFLCGNSASDADQARYEQLVQSLYPRDGRDNELNRYGHAPLFLQAVEAGRGVTLQNAKIIKKFLIAMGIANPRIEMLKGRADGGRMTNNKICEESERIFVGLDSDQIAILEKVKKALA